MSADRLQRKLTGLFCKLTMKLEDIHPIASRGMSRQLSSAHYRVIAEKVQKEAIQIVQLAALAEKLALNRRQKPRK